ELRRQRRSGEGGRGRHGAVAPEERGSAAGGTVQRPARVREGHPAREVTVVSGAREDGARGRILLGGDVQVLAGPRWSQHPIVVGEHAQPARPRGGVLQGEKRELDGVLRVHEDVELVAGAMDDASEPGQSRPVPYLTVDE